MMEVYNLVLFDSSIVSQRRAATIILDKKDDKSRTANYRPIALLNADYKIITKAIHCLPGRSIHSSLHRLDDTKSHTISPVAYDRVNTVTAFGCGPSFFSMIRLLYTNREVAMVIHGKSGS